MFFKEKYAMKKEVSEKNRGHTKAINVQEPELQLTTTALAFGAGDDILQDKNLIGSISKIIQEKLLKEDNLALEKEQLGNMTAREEMKVLSGTGQSKQSPDQQPALHTREAAAAPRQPHTATRQCSREKEPTADANQHIKPEENRACSAGKWARAGSDGRAAPRKGKGPFMKHWQVLKKYSQINTCPGMEEK